MMVRVLIVGGGLHLHTMLRALSPEIETVALCRAGTLSTVSEVDRNRAVLVLADDLGKDTWIQAARSIDSTWPVDALCSCSEVDQDKAAAVASALGLPFCSVETERWVNDKAAMRARLDAAGIPQVPYRRVGDAAALAEFLREVGPPLIVKPTGGRGSVGVSVVKDEAGVEPALRRALDAEAPRLVPSIPIAERFVVGRGLVVDGISHNGNHHIFGITETLVDEETQVDIAHVSPARLSGPDTELVLDHVRQVLTALDIQRGITNTDVILTAEGPVVLETHIRASGNRIPLLIEHTTGADLLRLWLRQIAGEDIGVDPDMIAALGPPRYSRAAAVRFLVPRQSGILAGIDGWDAVTRTPGVTHWEQLCPDGVTVSGLDSDFSYLGAVQVTAPTADEALELAEETIGLLRIRLQP
jgi:biotin carboxylase